MEFKSKAAPAPYAGKKKFGKKLTLPDQSMSLKEILTRFTRNEALPIGKDVEFHESEDDLEKVRNLDLTEQSEFLEKQKETQRLFHEQEKERIKKIREEERAKIRKEVKQQVEVKGEKLHKVHPSKRHRRDVEDGPEENG